MFYADVGSRSGETTPRPQSALSQHSGSSSVSATTRARPSTAPARKQRPISIAVTGVTSSNIDPVKQGKLSANPLRSALLVSAACTLEQLSGSRMNLLVLAVHPIATTSCRVFRF